MRTNKSSIIFMDDILVYLLTYIIVFFIILIIIGIRKIFITATDAFVDWIYKRIKEKEAGEYIEHQFDNSRRKHTP